MSEKKYSLGAKPSPPDSRDYRASKASYKLLQIFPDSFILDESHFQPIRNQGNEGTCVGHAAVDGVLGFFVEKQDLDRILSPRDAYEGGRSLEQPVPPRHVEGTYPRSVFKYLQKTGVCLEEDWPYQDKNPGTEFASAAQNRLLNKVFTYFAIYPLYDDIRLALMMPGPVLVCVPVYSNFYNPNSKTGIISAPKDMFAEIDGYHAIVICGWDQDKGWKIRNSWGTDWGQDGYAWLSFDYYISEAWSVIPSILDKLPEPEPEITPEPEAKPEIKPEPEQKIEPEVIIDNWFYRLIRWLRNLLQI
jgi:hypothetical protein